MTEMNFDGRAFPSLSRNKARKGDAKQTIKLTSNIVEPVLETCSLEHESCERFCSSEIPLAELLQHIDWKFCREVDFTVKVTP